MISGCYGIKTSLFSGHSRLAIEVVAGRTISEGSARSLLSCSTDHLPVLIHEVRGKGEKVLNEPVG